MESIKRNITTLFILTILLFLPFNAKALTVIQQADSAYNAQNYKLALSLYNKVLDTRGGSSQLYYNIGNSHYRLGNIGKAILNYERAHKLNPSNADVKANLEFVNSQIKGLPEDGSSFLSNIHKNIVSSLAPDSWSETAIIFFFIVLGCVSLYLFSIQTTLRKLGFFGAIIVFFLFVYSFIIAWQVADSYDDHDVAIVVTNNAVMSSNPGTAKNKEEKTILIPEGSKVEIIDSLATPSDPVTTLWYNVALNNNTHAWIAATDVEQI